MGHARTSAWTPPFIKGGRGDFPCAIASGSSQNPPHPPFEKGGSFSRRHFLASLAPLFAIPAFARAEPPQRVRLAAAWQAGTGYRVGILGISDEVTLAIETVLEVPTRAHGLLREASGSLLAVARRPGDWLLRWSAEGRPLAPAELAAVQARHVAIEEPHAAALGAVARQVPPEPPQVVMRLFLVGRRRDRNDSVVARIHRRRDAADDAALARRIPPFKHHHHRALLGIHLIAEQM